MQYNKYSIDKFLVLKLQFQGLKPQKGWSMKLCGIPLQCWYCTANSVEDVPR